MSDEVKVKDCPSCKLLRKQLIDAMRNVDDTDWDSMEGSKPRTAGAMLKDIAERLRNQAIEEDL